MAEGGKKKRAKVAWSDDLSHDSEEERGNYLDFYSFEVVTHSTVGLIPGRAVKKITPTYDVKSV